MELADKLRDMADKPYREADRPILRQAADEIAALNRHLDAAYEAASLSKSSSKPLACRILELQKSCGQPPQI